MPPRFSPEKEQEVIAAYQAWDGSMSVEDLAQSLGVSRAALYNILERHGIPTKLTPAVRVADPSLAEVLDRYEQVLAENARLKVALRLALAGAREGVIEGVLDSS